MADDDTKIDEKLVSLASRLSGGQLTHEDARKVLDNVKVNIKRLDDCVGPHDFQIIDGSVPRKFRCSKCHGEVSSSAAMWYSKGLEHGLAANN